MQNPFVEVSRGWVRLRLLNASNCRRYEMMLSDSRPFHVIASDRGFLPAPVAVQQLSLAPGERREVLLDMSQGEEVSITAGVAAGIMDRLRGLFEPSSILTSTLILTLRPTGLLPLVTDNLPMRLLADQILDGTPVRTRELRLGDAQPGINGALWDMSRIDIRAQQGTYERWIVHADTPQAFHIQGVMFTVKASTARSRSAKIAAGKIPSGSTAKSNCWWPLRSLPLNIFPSSTTARRWKWPTAARRGSCWCSRAGRLTPCLNRGIAQTDGVPL